MKGSLRVRVSAYENFLYLILIPFLYPRGFQESFPAYKVFFTAWLYLAMVFIAGMFIYRVGRQRLRYKSCVWVMILYYAAFFAITLATQGGIDEGLQKLFAAPTFCLLCAMCLRRRADSFIRCVSNLLIFNFALNATVFHPLLWKQYFDVDEHILFIGHVQIAAQVGVLGAFMAYLLFVSNHKGKARLLLLLSLATMLISETAASYIAILFIGLFYLLSKHFGDRRRVIFRPGMMIGLFLLANVVLLALPYALQSSSLGTLFALATNGRTFVWAQAMEMIKSRWLTGYGAYGVLFRTFWMELASNTAGMNYAHNELLQQMLDGGAVLLILFMVMMYAYIRNIGRVRSRRLGYWAHAMLAVEMIIMLFESVTEYYYFLVLLSFFAYLPEVERRLERKGGLHGSAVKN